MEKKTNETNLTAAQWEKVTERMLSLASEITQSKESKEQPRERSNAKAITAKSSA